MMSADIWVPEDATWLCVIRLICVICVPNDAALWKLRMLKDYNYYAHSRINVFPVGDGDGTVMRDIRVRTIVAG